MVREKDQAVGEEPGLKPLDGFSKDGLKAFAIAGVGKNGHPRIGAVENMIDIPGFRSAMWTSHAEEISGSRGRVSINGS